MKAQTPAETVADGIIEEVSKTSLVDAGSLPKLRTLLLGGNAKPEDWRFLLESSKGRGGDHGKQS